MKKTAVKHRQQNIMDGRRVARDVARNLFGGIKVFGGIKLLNSRSDVILPIKSLLGLIWGRGYKYLHTPVAMPLKVAAGGGA